MALETLKGLQSIGGFDLGWIDEHDGQNANCPIFINHDKNTITFRIQSAPVGEVGIDGCQVDTMIFTAQLILSGLNETHPCRENSLAITKLDEALMWLKKRTADRESRSVEGTNQK